MICFTVLRKTKGRDSATCELAAYSTVSAATQHMEWEQKHAPQDIFYNDHTYRVQPVRINDSFDPIAWGGES